MKATELLEKVKEKAQTPSDYKLAQILGVSKQKVSALRAEKIKPDAYTYTRIAEILEVDVVEVMAAIELEKAKTEERRLYWEAKAKTAREKREPLEVVASLGIEPRTRGFSIRCSTN